jgi:hypothetical protein
MYITSVFYKQIYSSLLHHRQFPNPAGVSPGRSGRPCPTRPEIEARLAGLFGNYQAEPFGGIITHDSMPSVK